MAMLDYRQRSASRPAVSSRVPKGFTLIEVMTVIAIMGILLAIAVPSFKIYFEKYRTKRAAETLAAFLVSAKSESIKRNANVRVVFQTENSGETWCAGMTTASTCDCATVNACQLQSDGVDRTVRSADFRGVILDDPEDGDMFGFTHQRGTVNGDTVRLESADSGYKMRVTVSTTGRIRLCSPDGSSYIGGYAKC